jgi:hypothetical protein
MSVLEPKSSRLTRIGDRFMWALGLILLVSCLGCATSPGGEPAPVTYREACFDPARITDFAPLGEGSVYLEVGDNTHYLLTLSRIVGNAWLRLPSRPFSTGITITGREPGTHFDRVCRGSEPWADYMDGDLAVHRRIDHIERVASKEAALELARARTATPAI